MGPLKIAILFGGQSGEHEVSITSAFSVLNALDKSKYEVTMVGIGKDGRWFVPNESYLNSFTNNPRLLKFQKEMDVYSLLPFANQTQLIKIDGGTPAAAKKFDVIFPVLHGPYGEDGTVQGLLELSHIPYVGSGVLGSAIGMDKDVARRLMRAAGIPVVPTLVFHRLAFEKNTAKTLEHVAEQLGYPYFVKPANLGSSVGVSKVKNLKEAAAKFAEAFQFDNKVLAEKAVAARELECSVLGNEDPKASIVGEIIPQHEFYSYEAKYLDENGATLDIPAKNLSAAMMDEIQTLAVKAFKILECRGLARVDFFLDKNTGELFLNEINTMPGFTKISMYPKLWAASGIAYSDLLDELIRLALDVSEQKRRIQTSYKAIEET
jgi:D-alanine-D-alanine ligase